MQFQLFSILLSAVLCTASKRDVLMLPNERATLDDCHLRFPKLQNVAGLVGPAFAHPSRLKDFSHLGAIGWTQSDGNVQWKCSGTLIWDNFVLTAAHCAVDSSNQAPDVARFGDLSIDIVEIVRFPEHRPSENNHDIALLKLEKNVTLHDTVTPACLWTEEEVRFQALEAIGWSRSSVDEQHTPKPSKFNLRPIDHQYCKKVYPNETELHENHICAVDDMNACEGISLGPLQIKLLHNGRMTPFLIGIKSFGMACGSYSPGVYTKVAPYLEWIVESMQELGAMVDGSTFNETFCALRYVAYREYEDSAIMSRSESYVSVDIGKRHMVTSNLPQYVVNLKWNSGERENCHGVIIDEDTVLTVAECATHNGSPVSHVQRNHKDAINVSVIHIHPEYIQGTGYNNIAILRLEKMLDTSNIEPTCIAHTDYLPASVDVYGFGRRDINDFSWIRENAKKDPTLTILKPRATIQNETTCKISMRHLPKLQNGLANEHICTGNGIFLVPGSCELMIGGPVQGKEWKSNSLYPVTFGLNQFGRDCGFGEHSIATSLASHAEWMTEVLLPNRQKTSSMMQFVDSDLHKNDSCKSFGEAPARCVPASMCTRKRNDGAPSGPVQFCSTLSVTCCPLDDIDNRGTRVHEDLVKCPSLVESLEPTSILGSTFKTGIFNWRHPIFLEYYTFNLGSEVVRWFRIDSVLPAHYFRR